MIETFIAISVLTENCHLYQFVSRYLADGEVGCDPDCPEASASLPSFGAGGCHPVRSKSGTLKRIGTAKFDA